MSAGWPTELTAAQSQALDNYASGQLGIPGLLLMENAGRGMAELLLAEKPQSVLVIAGKGNNGGDGMVIARHLDGAGVPVRLVLLADPAHLSPDARVQWTIISRSGIEAMVWASQPGRTDLLDGADWLVDALVGTGLSGPLQSPLAEVVLAINSSGAKVFAVDLPSGLHADTGQPQGPTVRASLTGTMAALKPGLLTPQGREFCGRVAVVGLGLPQLRDKRWLVC